MLGEWRSHADYLLFLRANLFPELAHNPLCIEYFENAIKKMYCLNLDLVYEDFAQLFPSTGRPSNQQPEILRSYVLMSHFDYAGIENWISYAKSSKLICALVGVTPDTFPGESTHRDFVTRLWKADDSNHYRKVSKKPKTDLGKEKEPPKHPGVIKYLVDKALQGETFDQIPEILLQEVFLNLVLIPSANMGLLGDTSKLDVCGDGVLINSNASPYGVKTCDCTETCSCPRKFSDQYAKWGWDNYHRQWFYGHAAYFLSIHNSDLKLDLPIYLKFVEAARFDGVTLIAALSHARALYKDFLSFDSLIADSAHDNYATYDLLNQWDIKPFIALNLRSSDEIKEQNIPLSGKGIPICADGHEMSNWGIDRKKYHIKYRCPLVTGRVKSCPYDADCNKTIYGKIVYIKLAQELRLLTPVPRDTEKWQTTYNQRTAAERVNNRILTDYQLERPKRYGKKKIAFFTFINAINVHLDAQIKFGNFSIDSLTA